MKILAVFFLSVLVGCHGDETCIDEKAESCVVELLTSIADDPEEYEVCKELQKSIECLESSVESCAEDELDAEIKQSIEDMKLLRSEHCKKYALSSEEHEEIEECFKSNENYFYECMTKVTDSVVEIFGEDDVEKIDENLLQCAMYGFLTECFVDRIDEKCGALAAETAMAEFRLQIPEQVVVACQAAEDMTGLGIHFLDDDNRKI